MKEGDGKYGAETKKTKPRRRVTDAAQDVWDKIAQRPGTAVNRGLAKPQHIRNGRVFTR